MKTISQSLTSKVNGRSDPSHIKMTASHWTAAHLPHSDQEAVGCIGSSTTRLLMLQVGVRSNAQLYRGALLSKIIINSNGRSNTIVCSNDAQSSLYRGRLFLFLLLTDKFLFFDYLLSSISHVDCFRRCHVSRRRCLTCQVVKHFNLQQALIT